MKSEKFEKKCGGTRDGPFVFARRATMIASCELLIPRCAAGQ